MNKRTKKARVWCPGGDRSIGSCFPDIAKDPSERKKVFQRCAVCDQRFELLNRDCCCPGSIHPRIPKHKAFLRPMVLADLERQKKEQEAIQEKVEKRREIKRGKVKDAHEPPKIRILCSICKVVPRRPNKPFCNTPECTRQGTRQERLYRKRQNELTREAEKLGMY
jgi:hypothetical protein